jgi:uncharacterized membrane protein YccC
MLPEFVTVAPPAPFLQSAPEGRASSRRAAVRRAVRVAIVNPATFAVSLLVIGDLQVATFAVFGCFALLVMANFGGNRGPRVRAYIGATLAGAVLLSLGTWVSSSAALGVTVMLLVGVALSFSGVFGGYVTAAQTALLLAFVLAVSIPATVSAIPARVEGWVLAGAVATLAGVFFWPWFERVTLREQAADACRVVAQLVDAARHHPTDEQVTRLRRQARAAVTALRTEYTQTRMRPAGPTRRHRAFVELMSHLEQLVDLSERPLNERPAALRPCIAEGNQLTAAVTAALRDSAAVLSGGAPPDVRALDPAWRAQRAALDRWTAEQLRAGRPPEEVLDGIDVDHTLRVVAYLTIGLGSAAVIVAGGRPEPGIALPAGIPRLEGSRGIAIRVVRTLRVHLEPSSTVLHNSLRTGIGLAISVLLARTLGLGHAFWVVLGTLSVLRSNALGTGRSTFQALAGNVIGFAVGGVFAAVAGNHPVVMWAAMPVVVFVAAYAASAIGFVAGQAAFTVTVILIFNLISPAGWQVGLVRIEDVAMGTGVSVLVGVLLWPRGARRDVARTVASMYRAVAEYLEHAFGLLLRADREADVARSRADAVRARDRAGEAFDAFLTERGAKPLDPQTAGRLVSVGDQALLAGDVQVVLATDLGYRAASCAGGAGVVEEQVRRLLAAIRHLADQLGGEAPDGSPLGPPSTAALRSAAIGCLGGAGTDEQAMRGAMAVAAAGEWVQNLAWLEADVEQPVRAAVDAAAIRWWR